MSLRIEDKDMKLLYVTSLSRRRINGFMRSAIIAARELGIDFTMACNIDMSDKEGYAEDCKNYGIKTVHIDFERNPLCEKNITAYRELLALITRGGMTLFIAIHLLVESLAEFALVKQTQKRYLSGT
jgi:hypothetical protein